MNFLRHNIVTLALVVIVAAITALNSFAVKSYLAEFHMNNSDLVAEVAFSASNRCDRMEATLNRLYQDYLQVMSAANQMSEELSAAAQHIQECHTLLEKAGIKPPEGFPLEQCQPDPLKIQADKDA